MGVAKPLEIQAGLADPVRPQSCQQSRLLRQLAMEIERQILLPGGETDVKPFARRGSSRIEDKKASPAGSRFVGGFMWESFEASPATPGSCG